LQKQTSISGEIKEGYRGAPAGTGLYNLSQEVNKKKQDAIIAKEEEKLRLAN
jgi:hypothetical protein